MFDYIYNQYNYCVDENIGQGDGGKRFSGMSGVVQQFVCLCGYIGQIDGGGDG